MDRELAERLDYIEFRQELLFDNDDVSRIVFEYKLTRGQYKSVMDLMDELRNTLDNGGKVSSVAYEQRMYELLPEHSGDYHMCEFFAKAFMEAGRWEEVFPALYGNNPKYRHLKGKE